MLVRGAFHIPHCMLSVIITFGRGRGRGFGSMRLSRHSAQTIFSLREKFLQKLWDKLYCLMKNLDKVYTYNDNFKTVTNSIKSVTNHGLRLPLAFWFMFQHF